MASKMYSAVDNSLSN